MRKKDKIQQALSFNPFGDMDGDGVPNILDCRPMDPKMDGFFGDLGGAIKRKFKKPSMIDYEPKKRDGILEGAFKKKTDPSILNYKPKKSRKLRDGFLGEVSGAAKTRIKGEISELKERTIEGISGEEARKHRKELKEAEQEAYYEKAKEQVAERGREKAQAKFRRHKPLLRGILGEDDDDMSDFGESIERTIKKVGKHGKGILKETSRSRVKTKMPDVKLPDTNLGGLNVLSGTLRAIKPTKKGTKLKVGTKMPDVQMPDVRW